MLHPSLVDCDRAVLVVVDIQEKLAAVMPRRETTVAVAVRLVRAAGVLGVPVLLTRQYPDGLGDTVPEVGEAYSGLPQDLKAGIVDKTAFCCDRETAFVSTLDATGREQVVLCGMETHICIAQTALALVAGGRRIQVVADAVCSRRDEDRDIALARLRAEGVVVTTSEAVMYEAVGRADVPAFKDLLRIVKGD
jgi:nicotinamidase-related amidase